MSCLISQKMTTQMMNKLFGHDCNGVEEGSHIREIPGFPPVLASELKHCILAHHGEFECDFTEKACYH